MTSPKHSDSASGAQPETAGTRRIRPTDGRVAMIPEAAIADVGLSPMELRVLCGIGVFCAAGRGGWPKQQTVADLLGVSRETVSRAVKTLRTRGHLKAIQKFRKSGGKRENHYVIPLDRALGDLEEDQRLVDDDEAEPQDTAPDDVTGSSHREAARSHRDMAPAITSNKDEQTNLNRPPNPQGGDEIASLETAFDEIWRLWPERGRKHSPGRALCLSALEKHGEGIPLASLVAAVAAFVRSSDPNFTPSLSKWLRERKFEAWLPKHQPAAIAGGASAFSTDLPPPPTEKAAKCLAAIRSRYGHTAVATWFRDATWDGDLIRVPTTFQRDRIEATFGGVLYEHGFQAVEGSAAA